jgi:phospholipase/carboxylesterase
MADTPFSHRHDQTDADSAVWRRSSAYVPRHYEPGYSYPLLVLFHGRGGDEHQLLRLMPKLSNRNYVAIGLRGPQKSRARRDGTVGFGWGQTVRGSGTGEGVATIEQPRTPQLHQASCDFLADYVGQAIGEVRGRFNIHADRVFLVGYGEGAAAAFRLGLGMPERFAGIIAVNGWMPRSNGPLLWLPQARRLRVLIAHGRDNKLVPISAAERSHRLLVTAGIDTNLQLLDAGHRIHTQLLRLINGWVMEHCNTPEQPTVVF